jgi:RNA polymerase sigma factor (sigma-70 family)
MTDQEFQSYVRANYDDFVRFVRSHVRRAQEAEDVVQQALLVLWTCRDRIAATAPGGYFFQSLRNAVVTAWRRQGTGPHSPLPEEGLPDPKAQPASPGEAPGPLGAVLEECDALERRGAVEEAVAVMERACLEVLQQCRERMTAPQREVFAASLRARGSQSEAMKLLELPSPTSYPNALHKARNQLRAVLSDYRDVLLRTLGAARLWELLCAVFCGCPAGSVKEDER